MENVSIGNIEMTANENATRIAAESHRRVNPLSLLLLRLVRVS